MAENLAFLPLVYSPNQSSPAYSYYVIGYHGTSVSAAKATSNYQTYGVLYTWVAAMQAYPSSNSVPSGVPGACPTGWHLPSNAEWSILANYLGGYSVAGGKMKETGTAHWNSPNTGATNSSGFTGLPSGYKGYASFFDFGDLGSWWTTYELDSYDAFVTNLNYNDDDMTWNSETKQGGRSMRCIKD